MIINCDWCGQEIDREPRNIRRSKNHFCGHECRGKWMSENWSGENHPYWKRVTVECTYCGQEIQRTPSAIEKNKCQFCSRECYGAWQSEKRVGKDAPNWQGGQGTNLTKRRTRERYRADKKNARNLAAWTVQMETLALAAQVRVMDMVTPLAYERFCQHQPVETWSRLQYWLDIEREYRIESIFG